MNKDGINIKGFFRVNIEEDGKIVGDSGWCENVVTDLGYSYYLTALLGADAASLQIGFLALGTGGEPATNAVTLPGEISGSTKRTAITFANVASTTAQFTATFGSAQSFLAGDSTLDNVGLYALTTTDNQLFAGNTYTGSSCGTNQNVNVTYQIRFS